MKVVAFKCNHCGADLDLDLDNLKAKCPYCGRKLMIDLDDLDELLAAKEQTKQAQEKTSREREKTLRKKMQLEHEEKKDRFDIKVAVFLMLGMLALSAVMFVIPDISGLFHSASGDAEIPISAQAIEEDYYNYKDVERLFNTNGFENIEFEKEDLKLWSFKKDGQVIKVSINGDTDFSEGEWVDPNSQVLITYGIK